MRVLHILEATEGGTRRHVLDLLPRLQARGVKCSLIFSSLRNPGFHHDANFLQQSGVETREIPMGHRWERGQDFQAICAIHTHLKKHRYDLIHCHSSNAGLLARLANLYGQSRSTPLVYTPHYVAFGAGVPRLQRRGALYLEKLLASQTSHYIAVSQHEYSLLRRVLSIEANRIGMIHNGVDVDAWQNAIARVKVRGCDFVIGCFGRLTAQKNQITLIRALPGIAREIPDARLKLVGAGEDESTLRAEAKRLGCDNRVDFCGEVSDLAMEYAGCDIVAHPSRWEGCSYALLEAAAASRAIIASTAGGNPEVIGDAGVLLPARDIAAWTNEICALALDEARRKQLGEAALARVQNQFRIEAMIEKTLAAYQSVLAGEL
jgi:glycosyltransferase involved in cell wall biosynthesis